MRSGTPEGLEVRIFLSAASTPPVDQLGRVNGFKFRKGVSSNLTGRTMRYPVLLLAFLLVSCYSYSIYESNLEYTEAEVNVVLDEEV